MKFPLKHPKFICLDKTVDDFLTNEGFSIPNIRYRIKNKIKSYFKN